MATTAKRLKKAVKDMSTPKGKWSSKRGLWLGDNEMPISNSEATLKVTHPHDVVKHYAGYLKGAMDAGQDGELNFDTYNAKQLVWEMGNGKSLPAIRNVIYKFCNDNGLKLQTLKTGPRAPSQTAEQRIAKNKQLWAQLGLDDYVVTED